MTLQAETALVTGYRLPITSRRAQRPAPEPHHTQERMGTTMRTLRLRNFTRHPFAMFVVAVVLAVSMTPAHAKQVPFKAGVVSAMSGPQGGPYTLAGEGWAQHAGRVVTAGSLTITGSAACADGFAVQIEDTFSAANGDEVSILMIVQACPTEVAGVYDGNGSYTVQGGTGRFSEATGAGVFVGVGDFINGVLHCTLNGTITY